MKMNRIIVEAVLAGKSQSQVAKQYGISQPRVSQLMARWRHGGWPALEHQSRRPHTNPKTTPTAITTRILQLREEPSKSGCDNGAQSIAHALATENLHVPANSTIWRIPKKTLDASHLNPKNVHVSATSDSKQTYPMNAGNPISPTTG